VLFKFKVVVKDDERAFLLHDGRFERLLGPGRFVALDYGRRLTAEVVKVARAEIAADKRCCSPRRTPTSPRNTSRSCRRVHPRSLSSRSTASRSI